MRWETFRCEKPESIGTSLAISTKSSKRFTYMKPPALMQARNYPCILKVETTEPRGSMISPAMRTSVFVFVF